MALIMGAGQSVFGGCFDPEFEKWSNKLWEEFKVGSKIAIISDLTLKELEESPQNVRNLLKIIPKEHKEFITLNEEAKVLALRYIKAEVVSEGFMIDAQHIAIATIYGADVLVSWNFKHIVNLTKIRLYNAVNLTSGYRRLEIRSPMEVLYEK